MRRNTIVPVFFVVVILCISTHFANAAEDVSDLQKKIVDRKGKIEGLQKQIDAMKKLLLAKQLEKTSLQNQVGIINGRIEKGKLDIKATKTQLEQTDLVLKETQLNIEQKQKDIAEQNAQISDLVRALDFSERQTVVAVFASGRTLSDYFSAQDAVHSVDTELTRALIKVMLAKQDLDKQKEQLDGTKKSLESQKQNLLTKQDQLLNQNAAKSQLLTQTQQSEQKFQKLVADLKRQYSATEGEIESIEREVRKKLNGSGRQQMPTGPANISWPTPSRSISATFHDPDYPFRHIFEHPGIDIRAAQGTPIRAAGNGIIARAKNAGMGYSYVIIVHNNKISTLYGHLSRIMVKEDDAVSTGDIIAYSGGTPGTPGAGPFVTGPHLHFEVRLEGIPVNPLDYLP